MNKIEMTYFRNITELNEWSLGSTNLEIISIQFLEKEKIHLVYYRIEVK